MLNKIGQFYHFIMTDLRKNVLKRKQFGFSKVKFLLILI